MMWAEASESMNWSSHYSIKKQRVAKELKPKCFNLKQGLQTLRLRGRIEDIVTNEGDEEEQ